MELCTPGGDGSVGLATTREAGGLYVHIPFCATLCPYCDFARVQGSSESRARYLRTLVAEIELCADCSLRFDTVYFGGGTPSILEPGELGEILDALRTRLELEEDSGVFLEANPDDVSASRLKAWKSLGVKTLSLGIQSFHSEELRYLGRRHDRQRAIRSLELARQARFHTLSIDLIYGLPGQQRSSWQRNLDEAVRFEPQHVSCYQLTIKDKTSFGRRKARGQLAELPGQAKGEFFRLTHAVLENAGYEAYEVSNFAREASHRSRHNQKYWTHTPYLGLGLAAHSYQGNRRWWNESNIAKYESFVASRVRPVAGSETLSDYELALETVLLGVRTKAGIDLHEFEARYGIDLVERNAALVEQYVKGGIATIDGNRLRLTRRGFAVADAVARDLEIGALPGWPPALGQPRAAASRAGNESDKSVFAVDAWCGSGWNGTGRRGGSLGNGSGNIARRQVP